LLLARSPRQPHDRLLDESVEDYSGDMLCALHPVRMIGDRRSEVADFDLLQSRLAVYTFDDAGAALVKRYRAKTRAEIAYLEVASKNLDEPVLEVFTKDAKGVVRALGSGYAVVEAADFDGDGAAEVVLERIGTKFEGFLLLDQNMNVAALFERRFQ